MYSYVDQTGWRTYRRPDEKSGGHGVGWSPIIPYSFQVPDGWEEVFIIFSRLNHWVKSDSLTSVFCQVPVSIADLGGTEIDLRFANSKEGRLFIIVAPVLRFSGEISSSPECSKVGFKWYYDRLTDIEGDVTVEKIGPPEKVINAFGPEVIGENVEGKVGSMEVKELMGRTYYQFELEPPHVLITATAAGNRLYLFNVTGSGKNMNYLFISGFLCCC